jgi:hypothetical protein
MRSACALCLYGLSSSPRKAAASSVVKCEQATEFASREGENQSRSLPAFDMNPSVQREELGERLKPLDAIRLPFEPRPIPV